MVYYIRRDVPYETARPQRIKRERFLWCVLLLGVEGHSYMHFYRYVIYEFTY